ncbi:hypothetical protein GUI43_05804 [Micromonospora noduli]|nr:hypothetical protein GUI43_05804 [Micromonospora noduli]
MQIVGRVAGIQGPPHTRRGDPVHAGPAGRLQLGHRLQLDGERRLGWAGHHHGQVGLHQEMVDRCGQQGVQRPSGTGRVAALDIGVHAQRVVTPLVGRRQVPQQQPTVRGERPQPRHAQLCGLGQHLPVGGVPAPAATRSPPVQQLLHLLRGGCRRRLQIGEYAEHRPSGGRHAGPLGLGGEHGDRPVPVVTAAHQPHLPGHGQPRSGELLPPLGQRGGPPHLVPAGRQHLLIRPVPTGGRTGHLQLTEEPRRVRHLQQQRCGRFVQPGGTRQPAQVPYTDATRTQHRRGLVGELLQQPLGVPDHLQGLPGPGRVDRLRLARRGGHRRWAGAQGPEGAAVAAQQEADLAGQLHRSAGRGRTGRHRDQQPVVDEPPHRGAGRGAPVGRVGQDRVLRAERRRLQCPGRHAAHRRAGRQPVQDRPGRGRGGEHRPSELRRVRAERGRARVQLRGRSAEPCGVRGDLVDGGQHLERVLRAVQQEERT